MAGRITFTLTDLRDGVTREFAGSSVAYDPATGYAKTKPVALQAGDEYEVHLAAAGLSGGTSNWSWRFRSMKMVASKAAATITGSTGSLTGDPGSNTWTIVPRLDMGHFTVQSTPTEHSGWGPIKHSVPLQSAHVDYVLNGIQQAMPLHPYGPDQTMDVYHTHTMLTSMPASPAFVYGQSVLLMPVTVSLPAGASDPVLSMETVEAQPSIPAADCPDPTSGPAGCTPDPLRFWVPEDFAGRIAASPTGPGGADPTQQTPRDKVNVFIGLVKYVCGAAADEFDKAAKQVNSWHCSTPQPHWAPADPGSAVKIIKMPPRFWSVCGGAAQRACDELSYIEGVHYGGSFIPQVPQQFTESCNIGFPCVSERAATSSQASAGYACQPSPCPDWLSHPGGYDNHDVQQSCIFIDGYNKPTDGCKEEQAAVVFNVPGGPGTQTLSGGFVSQIGLADDTQNGPWCNCPRPGLGSMRDPAPADGVGISFWDDNHTSGQQKWQFINDYQGSYFVNGDAYYNRDDMPWCGFPARCPIPPFRSITEYHGDTQHLDLSPGIQAAVTTQPVQSNSSSDSANQGWGYAMSIPYRTGGFYGCGSGQFPRSCPRTSIQYQNVCGSSFPLVNPSSGARCGSDDGTHGHFYGYYDPDVCNADPGNPNYYCSPGYQPFDRDGMERTYKYILQGDWRGADYAQAGTFMLSYGHKFEEFDVNWKWGWGFDIFPEPGPGFGFSFEPDDAQKETMTYAAVRYCFGGASC